MLINGDNDDVTTKAREGRRWSALDARAFASATTRPAASTRAGGARTAPARKVAPRLAESKRFDSTTEPLSPPQTWLQDFLMKFLRDELRSELKRRGHSPTGLK